MSRTIFEQALTDRTLQALPSIRTYIRGTSSNDYAGFDDCASAVPLTCSSSAGLGKSPGALPPAHHSNVVDGLVPLRFLSLHPSLFELSQTSSLRRCSSCAMAVEHKPEFFELRKPVDSERSPPSEDEPYHVKSGTAQDDADMHRLGKKQQLSV